jgi:hypothetical protein
MPAPVPVEDLLVIGYGAVLDESMWPSIVPPVFALRADLNTIFVPPYSFNSGYLCNASRIHRAEAESLADSEEITLLPDSLPARAEHELWIDEHGQLQYQPVDEAARLLRALAEQYVKQAAELLAQGKLDEALSAASRAGSADDSFLDPFVIQAAIHRARGHRPGEELMAELASTFTSPRNFRALVDLHAHWLESLPH